VLISSLIDWLVTIPASASSEESISVEKKEGQVVEGESVITVVPVIQNGHSNGHTSNGHGEKSMLQGSSSILVTETDKLTITMSAMRVNRRITEEELSQLLGLKRAESARFWKVKAEELLRQEEQGY